MQSTFGVTTALENVVDFAQFGSLSLRAYQLAAAQAVIDSVIGQKGRSLVVMFPRQSGKNEIQAQLEAYLLTLYADCDAEIVKVSPTARPQSQNAMRRLERVLKANAFTAAAWQKESGFIYRVEKARIFFLSAAPEANIVGATASLLLEVDEAQDVSIEKYDREIAPMAASTNATRVFWGTAWTDTTLLARELRAGQEQEQRDGVRRVFRLTADDVAAEAASYGKFVAGQVARFGRSHPMIRTQYFSEELQEDGGMFPAARLAMMQGSHAWHDAPRPGETYAFLIDVGGEAREGAAAAVPGGRRDSTALVIVAVEQRRLPSSTHREPVYRVVHLRQWTCETFTRLHDQLGSLAETWRARRVVIDATGLGEGLASFLNQALPGRVIRYTFNQGSKTRLGWKFLEVVESGRFQLPLHAGLSPPPLLERLRAQLRACTYQAGSGAETLRWSVPEAARDPLTGGYMHDDLLLASALCAVLDDVDWPAPSSATLIIHARDPLEERQKF